jgi:nucleotide-binding universal stress UspA family protein
MKTLEKYGPQTRYNREFSLAGSYEKDEVFIQTPAFPNSKYLVIMSKEGESRVTNVKNDKTSQQVFDLAVMQKRYLGFSLFKKSSDPAEVAKKLGKSYHLAEKEIKGNKTPKKHNVMKTFEIKRILVPTDFSETGLLAIDHAAFMARLFKAHLYMLHVIESFEYAYSEYEPELLVKDAEGVQDVITEKLERLAASLGNEYGIHVSALVNNGRPAMGVAEVVKDNDIDLIIMGTHGAKGFEELIIGSNAHKVVSHSSCPVITIQATAKSIGFTNIVMPIDNSLHSRQKVDYVIELAKKYGSRIHILGLLDSDEEAEERKFTIKLDSVENVIKNSELPYTRKLVKGYNVAVEAMKYSEEVNADLLVIMTDHESNMSGDFLGAIAKQVVNHSKVPVMSIRPDSHYEYHQEIL